ncbi:MAG: CNNM domain-containing protein, partial [Pseudomonadota bacterium]
MEMGELIAIGAVCALLLLSGFFSGSETALTAANPGRIHGLAQGGDRRAKRVEKLQSDKDRLIGGVLLGNNLANILASSLATSVLIAVFGETGVVYATLVMTTLVVIFAEVMPKTYAIYHAEKMSLAVALPIQIVIAIFAPIVHAVRAIVRGVFRLLRIEIGSGADAAEREEALRGAIEMHSADEEARDEREMLRSILELDDVAVSEIMT